MFKCYGKVGETIHQRLCVQVPHTQGKLSLQSASAISKV